MQSKDITYRSLDDLYSERHAVAAHWKIIAQLSSWMLLGGFLLLLTTFDQDPQLRISSAAIIIILVALLAGGYSLSFLLWFACPSIIFRLEYILLPSATSSVFGFIGCIWALVSSNRFNPNLSGSPVTIVLTIVSAGTYGILALYCHGKINKITSGSSWTAPHNEDRYGSYSSYASSMYPLTKRSRAWSADTHPPGLSEDEMVNFQMARLLSRGDEQPSPDPTSTTFRIEWPGDLDDDGSVTGTYLSPEDAARQGRRWTGPVARIGEAMGMGDRGRRETRNQEEANARAKSREEKRRQIELASLEGRNSAGH